MSNYSCGRHLLWAFLSAPTSSLLIPSPSPPRRRPSLPPDCKVPGGRAASSREEVVLDAQVVRACDADRVERLGEPAE
eukprot:9065005-Pyramimonas_sp.AAC.1